MLNIIFFPLYFSHTGADNNSLSTIDLITEQKEHECTELVSDFTTIFIRQVHECNQMVRSSPSERAAPTPYKSLLYHCLPLAMK